MTCWLVSNSPWKTAWWCAPTFRSRLGGLVAPCETTWLGESWWTSIYLQWTSDQNKKFFIGFNNRDVIFHDWTWFFSKDHQISERGMGLEKIHWGQSQFPIEYVTDWEWIHVNPQVSETPKYHQVSSSIIKYLLFLWHNIPSLSHFNIAMLNPTSW